MSFTRSIAAIGLIGIGLFVAWRVLAGPVKAYGNKGRFFADGMNALVDQFGTKGTAVIVMLVAVVAAAAVLRGERNKRR